MNRLLPLSIIFLHYFAPCAAQDYVVNSKGDTLRGAVKLLTYSPDKKVQVVNAQKKKYALSILSTRAVSIDGNTYHPVRTARDYVFMKVISPGYLTLYAYQQDGQLNYDGLYLVMKDGRRTEVPNLGFKKTIGILVYNECPALAAAIEDGKLRRQDIVQIVEKYNACIDARTQHTTDHIQQQNQSLLKVNQWTNFEEEVTVMPDFERKSEALEIIGEIKNKLQLTHKIPAYLGDALKRALTGTTIQAQADSLLSAP